MIRNSEIKALIELQKIAQSHAKKISQAFETWRIMGPRIEEIMKPFLENMASIREKLAYVAKIDLTPHKDMLSSLQFLQERIGQISYPVVSSSETVSSNLLLMPDLKKDQKFKRLIKEAIQELQQEASARKEAEIRESAEKRKIKGFAIDRDK